MVSSFFRSQWVSLPICACVDPNNTTLNVLFAFGASRFATAINNVFSLVACAAQSHLHCTAWKYRTDANFVLTIAVLRPIISIGKSNNSKKLETHRPPLSGINQQLRHPSSANADRRFRAHHYPVFAHGADVSKENFVLSIPTTGRTAASRQP